MPPGKKQKKFLKIKAKAVKSSKVLVKNKNENDCYVMFCFFKKSSTPFLCSTVGSNTDIETEVGIILVY